MMILDSHIEGAQLYAPEVRGDIYRAIIEYGYYGMEPDWLKGEALGFFIAIRPTLDTKKSRSNAGRASGEARRSKAEQNANKRVNKTRTNPRTKREQNSNVFDEKNGQGEEGAGEDAGDASTDGKPGDVAVSVAVKRESDCDGADGGTKREQNDAVSGENAEQHGMAAQVSDEQNVNKSGTNPRTKREQTREQNANEEEEEEERVFVSNETNNPIAPTEVAEVVDYLNERAGRSYRASSEATAKLIRARLAEGFTVADCRRVVDNKVASWLGDPKMDAYLRPTTLFAKSKFEAYLNERPARGGGRFDDYAD